MAHRRRLVSASFAAALLQGCSGDIGGVGPENPPPENALGTIALTMRAGGTALDPDGYTIRVDGIERGPVAVKGTTWIRGVPPGSTELELSGVDASCDVEGGNRRTVAVPTGDVLRITVEVRCDGSAGEPTTP